jgi:hypothetical protein
MPLDPRRVAPPAIAALVVGALVVTLFVHRDAEPLPDPSADRERARREAVDLYATSGEDKRLTGESDPTPSALPTGHPPPAPLPEGHPPLDPPAAPSTSG